MTERTLRSSRQDKQCRICLQNEDCQSMLSPCDCRGSIQNVHLACLQQYYAHKFKTANSMDRRRMRDGVQCQICKAEIKCLRISSNKRCANCEELSQRMQSEDVFFIVVFMLLYLGFHAIGIILIIQDSLVSKIIGGFWLLLSFIAFNYGLYKIVKEVCYVREPQVTFVVGP